MAEFGIRLHDRALLGVVAKFGRSFDDDLRDDFFTTLASLVRPKLHLGRLDEHELHRLCHEAAERVRAKWRGEKRWGAANG
jgi:hypothetical protein